MSSTAHSSNGLSSAARRDGRNLPKDRCWEMKDAFSTFQNALMHELNLEIGHNRLTISRSSLPK